MGVVAHRGQIMDGYLEKAVLNMFVYPVNTYMCGALDWILSEYEMDKSCFGFFWGTIWHIVMNSFRLISEKAPGPPGLFD